MSVRVDLGDDGVCRVTLDRPEARHALTPEMRDALTDAVRRARRDPAARALLLRSTGDAFCAGMDLRHATIAGAGTDGFDPREVAEALRNGVQAFVRELWELDKPTVAAVQGPAVGPGAHLALACDFVLVEPGTRFLWSFHRVGLVADGGGAHLLPRLVGLARAKAMLMLGEPCTGAQAAALGLVHRCCDGPEALATEAEALARRLADGPTRALGLTKRLLNGAFETPLPEALAREADAQATAATTADVVEGLAAFRERRDARFQGR